MMSEGINDNQMTIAAGLSVGLIGKAKSSGKGMSSMNIEKILLAYPNLSPEWLLTGKGEMIKTKRSENTQLFDSDLSGVDKDNKNNPNKQEKRNKYPTAHHAEKPTEGIPLIPFSAMAGALTSEQSVLEYECERYVIPAFSGADFLMPVKGNSMSPTYVSGDIVACQRVPMAGLFFQWNKPYVLDTTQGPLIKRIKPGSDKQHVLIVSDNPQFDPFELLYEDIHAVALVIGIIRLE